MENSSLWSFTHCIPPQGTHLWGILIQGLLLWGLLICGFFLFCLYQTWSAGHWLLTDICTREHNMF
jgi:hypothetical protein